jgi:imidazoleglycerol phosphate dehydratase HisB
METKYIQARKTIETKTEGEFELNKIHVLKVEDTSLINSLEDLSEKDEDDYECAYYNGFIFDMDECLYIVNVDRLTEHLKSEIENEYTDDDDSEKYKLLIESLKKFEGYELYIKTEVKQEAMQSEARHSSQP